MAGWWVSLWLLSMCQNPLHRNGVTTRTWPYQHTMEQSHCWSHWTTVCKKLKMLVMTFALTCIDTTTSLVEFTCIDNKSSDAIERNLNKPGWLGILDQYASSTMTVANLLAMPLLASFIFWKSKMSLQQAKTLNQIQYVNKCLKPWKKCLRPYSCLPQTPQDVLHLVDEGLATTMHSMRSTISTTLKASRGILAFSQDMLLNVSFIAKWQIIPHNRKALVNNALIKPNQHHQLWLIFGQHVLKYDQTVKGKLAIKTSDSFTIVGVNVNGTVTIQQRLGVTEHINICCTISYNEPLV